MKRLVRSLALAAVCGLVMAATPAAHAQGKPAAPAAAAAPPKKPRRPSMLETMTKVLGLSPAQQTQLKAVYKAHGDKKKSIDNALLTADGRKSQMKALDEATNTQMAAILTPAQRAKYAQFEAERRAARASAAAAAAAKKP